MTQPEGAIDPSVLYDYCDTTAGYELLARLIAVGSDPTDIDLVPRSRQELRSEVPANNRTIDRRLKKGYEELAILLKETGEQYEQYDDLQRIYRIAPDRIAPPALREIKMKGYFRPRQPNSTVPHANVAGGESNFGPLPGWSDFVRKHLDTSTGMVDDHNTGEDSESEL